MMRDLASPMTTQPPPSSPAPPQAFKLPMLYCGLVVMGAAAVVLGVYSLVINKWRANLPINEEQMQRLRRGRSSFMEAVTSSHSLENPNRYLLSSFMYKGKREDAAKENVIRSSDYLCAVCLSAFEQGEEVRRLPRCNHSFHAPCIDMWLYSHHDCPLCRALVAEARPTILA